MEPNLTKEVLSVLEATKSLIDSSQFAVNAQTVGNVANLLAAYNQIVENFQNDLWEIAEHPELTVPEDVSDDSSTD